MRTRSTIRVVLLVSGLLAFGSVVVGLRTDAPQAAAAELGESTTFEVSITDSGFQPQDVQVAPGTTVLWTNNGTQPQTLVSSTGTFESDPLLPGDSFLFSFSDPGTSEYTSGPLLGRVIVGTAVDVAGARASLPAVPASGAPGSVAGSPAAVPGAAPDGLAFTGAAESLVLATLGVVIVLLGWSMLAAFGVARVVEPWRILGFGDPRRLGFTDELLPRGLWRPRPRSTTQATLLPAPDPRRTNR